MEVKGIAWVENIYQRFEAVCLEVEEMMYEDTVKYVENQMQTVGGSVKKLCLDIMDDLLPPSSVESENEEETESSCIEQISEFEISNECLTEEHASVDVEQVTKDERVFANLDEDVYCISSNNGIHNFFASSSSITARGECYDSYLRKYSDVSMLPESSLHISQNNDIKKILSPSPVELSGEITHTGGNDCRVPSLWELLNENNEAVYDSAAMISNQAPMKVAGFHTTAEKSNEAENANECLSNISSENLSPEMMSLVQSAEKIEINNDIFKETDELSDCWGLSKIDSHSSLEKGQRNSRQAEKLKLEETCVMVSGEALQDVPQAGGKQRHYKKNFGETFLSRRKRMQEYKQLAMLYGDAKANEDWGHNSILSSAMSDFNNSPSDICDSGWELVQLPA